MKFTKFLSAVALMAAFSFAACNTVNEPVGPGQPSNPQDTGKVTPPPTGDTINVAKMLEMTAPDKGAGTQKIVVKAYIVGSYNFDNDPKFIIGTDNVVNSNILIADDPENTDTYKVASVKLDAGIFRNALNLVDNAGNYKKPVVLVGVFEKYCGINGMVSVEKAVLDGNEIVAPENPEPGSTITATQLLGMTVAAKGEGTDKYWVEAYIVGSYNFDNDPKFVIGTDNAVKTSILLADDADETDTYKVVSVKLAADVFRDKLNIVDNPANYKKKVKIYGTVEKYCGINGVVNIEKAELDGQEIKEEEINAQDGGAVTVAEFLTKPDSKEIWYTLTGTIKNLTNTTYGNFDLEDATGTVYVYGLTATQQVNLKNDKSFASLNLKEGDNITICGPKSTYQEKIEVNCAYFIRKN